MGVYTENLGRLTMKMTLAQIKAATQSLDSFYDDDRGFLNKAGVCGQLGWDAIRVMNPNTGLFGTWVVDVDLINAGINDHVVYSCLDAGKKPTKCWKTAVARAVKVALDIFEFELDITGYEL